ncbi:MAG: UDP-N-acetylglucosamine 2-epimerase (non-hydrolyzing) [Myxococcales bacterium]|nr:UDP-N-acetylglucosamine 2-epimerase (non-hydrolyzing) [Myxococcales bacterium]
MDRPVVHIVGARPQFVKAAAVLAVTPPAQRPRLLHTGQHYAPALSDIFFADLALPAPDISLGVGSGPHGAQTGAMLAGIEAALAPLGQGVAVVYGDTNTTLAGALAAAKLGWRVAHVEAGLRADVRDMPEEINRVVCDHVADALLCPTRRAVLRLGVEGLAARAAFVGDVMLDLARRVAAAAADTPIARRLAGDDIAPEGPLAALPERAARREGFYLATVHRAANTDDPRRLRALFEALGALPHPTLLPLHPRTAAALKKTGIKAPPGVVCVEPLGYLDFAALLAGCRGVLTDSGGVQKEALFAGTPCTTLRAETEWPETLAGGWNQLADADPAAIVAAATRPRPEPRPPVDAFGDGHAAERVVAAVDALRA